MDNKEDNVEDITLRKAVQFAISVEQLGNECYERLARRFSDDEEISRVFSVLAKDELLHEKHLQKLLVMIPEEEPEGYAEKYGVLRAMSLSEFFTSRDGLRRALEQIETREDALQRAFELERSTLGYYQALKDVLGENPVLEDIIQMEKDHMMSILRYMVTGAKLRGLGDRVPQLQ